MTETDIINGRGLLRAILDEPEADDQAALDRAVLELCREGARR